MNEKYKELLIHIINKHTPKASIYLFGSRSQNRSHPGSDIDLALDSGKKINMKIISDIIDEISESDIPFFVDVIDLNAIDEHFRKSIEKDLVTWK